MSRRSPSSDSAYSAGSTPPPVSDPVNHSSQLLSVGTPREAKREREFVIHEGAAFRRGDLHAGAADPRDPVASW